MKAGGTEIVYMVNHAKQSHLRWLFIARLEWEEVVGKWGECVKHFGPLLWSQVLTVASGYDSSSCYHLQVPPTSWTGRALIHLRFVDCIQFPHFLVDDDASSIIIISSYFNCPKHKLGFFGLGRQPSERKGARKWSWLLSSYPSCEEQSTFPCQMPLVGHWAGLTLLVLFWIKISINNSSHSRFILCRATWTKMHFTPVKDVFCWCVNRHVKPYKCCESEPQTPPKKHLWNGQLLFLMRNSRGIFTITRLVSLIHIFHPFFCSAIQINIKLNLI